MPTLVRNITDKDLQLREHPNKVKITIKPGDTLLISDKTYKDHMKLYPDTIEKVETHEEKRSRFAGKVWYIIIEVSIVVIASFIIRKLWQS